MSNVIDWENDDLEYEAEYIEPTGSCHANIYADVYADDEHDCLDYMCCEECPYWY